MTRHDSWYTVCERYQSSIRLHKDVHVMRGYSKGFNNWKEGKYCRQGFEAADGYLHAKS